MDTTAQNILEVSDHTKAQADHLLGESNLIEVLSGYGEVKIAGSYTLNVMLRPDLDLFVVAKSHDLQKLLAVAHRLIAERYFHEVTFVNWVDSETGTPDDAMRGYYFNLGKEIGGVPWKVDVWLVTPDQDKSAELTEHFKKLLDPDPQNTKRMAILEIKQAMREGRKYTKGVDGKLVYRAVLENGILDVENFKKSLPEKGDTL